MKLDAHQHFWYYRQEEYPWIDEGMKSLQRDFLPAELEKELNSMNFDGSIAVQARQSIGETRWLLALADQYDFIRGVVGWVDLRSPEIDTQLETFGHHRKLVGVRHVIHDEPDINFMLLKSFKEGLSRLSEYKLTYDLLLFPEHLPNAIRLVDEFPDQVFVLDHISKPPIKHKIREPWYTHISELARFPNVFCKLSGMVTEADWEQWKKQDLIPYLDSIFKCFGPDRLMIGSDWPVCTVAASYQQTLSLVIEYLEQFDKTVQEKVLGGNCEKVYLEGMTD